MPFLKILRFFLLFLPFSLFGQSVQENLESINAQLAQFNNFQTSFELDQVAKTIICRDKFGTYSAFLKDIVLEKDDSGKNIEIYCLDESKCISSLKKDGSPGSSFSSYSIGLSQNADTVSSIEEIIEQFSFIKKAILESDFAISNTQTNHLKNEVELQLQKLNTIFKAHAQNQTVWSFDWDNYWLIEERAYCKMYVPLEKISIDYYERENVQTFRNGFVFKASGNDILEKCTEAENHLFVFYDYLDSLKYVEESINAFKTIQNLVATETGVGLPATSENIIEQHLSYINNQFSKYNKYHTRFYVDLTNRELLWIQDFGESRAPIEQLDFKADIENGWIVIKCKDESSKCVTTTSPDGKKLHYNEYSMSLKEYDRLIPHINEVIEKFTELSLAVEN